MISPVKFYHPLEDRIQMLLQEFDEITEGRKNLLRELTRFVEGKLAKNQQIQLIFICTHNSRRSHIAQIWAETAAAFFGVEGVVCFSGGTEATAFNPRAVKAMEQAGFKIVKTTPYHNPLYNVYYGENAAPIRAFSKKYDDDENPKTSFTAIMTCSHADENCPVVLGSEKRIAITYDDPKEFDGTPQETQQYNERVRQIGREMLYAFSKIQTQYF